MLKILKNLSIIINLGFAIASLLLLLCFGWFATKINFHASPGNLLAQLSITARENQIFTVVSNLWNSFLYCDILVWVSLWLAKRNTKSRASRSAN